MLFLWWTAFFAIPPLALFIHTVGGESVPTSKGVLINVNHQNNKKHRLPPPSHFFQANSSVTLRDFTVRTSVCGGGESVETCMQQLRGEADNSSHRLILKGQRPLSKRYSAALTTHLLTLSLAVQLKIGFMIKCSFLTLLLSKDRPKCETSVGAPSSCFHEWIFPQ